MNPQQIAQIIKQEIDKRFKEVAQKTFYRGVVTATNGNYCSVALDGSTGSIPNILCLNGYSPAVDDRVLVLSIGTTGANFLAIGTINSAQRQEIMFKAYRSSSRAISASTFTIMGANSIEYNIGNCYTNTDNESTFTAPFDGIYHIGAGVYTDPATNTRSIIELRRNDSTAGGARVYDIAATDIRQTGASLDLILNAGDTIKPYVWTILATNIGSSPRTNFFGHLIKKL